MNSTIKTAGRFAAVAAMTLCAVGLYRADSQAQQIARARISPPTVVVTAPTATPAPRVVQAAPQTVVAPASPVEGLRVRRFVVARSIEDREPQEVSTRFNVAPGDRLYAFVELENRSTPTSVRVRFEPRTGARRSVGLATLNVGAGPRYRTWAYSDFVRTPGEWSAVVESADGRELARTPFIVE